MITFIYDPIWGTPFRDGKCAQLVQDCIDDHKIGEDVELIAATENIFLALRVAIKQKRVSHLDARIRFIENNQFGTYDEDGRSEFWPDGFCDYTEKQLLQLL